MENLCGGSEKIVELLEQPLNQVFSKYKVRFIANYAWKEYGRYMYIFT